MRWTLCLLLVSACSFQGGSGTNGDDASTDARVNDGEVPDVSANECMMFDPPSTTVNPCDVPPDVAWTITAPGGIYDTTTGTYDGGMAPESYDMGGIRIVSVAAFAVEEQARVRVIGDKPLLVLSWSSIVVNGELDASSIRTDNMQQVEGGGANGPSCIAAGNGAGSSDSGGGGGGGFGAAGGKGGQGNGGVAGKSIAVPSALVGGCEGGAGGTDTGAGDGGAGGGALLLVAKDSLTISSTGRLHAGGAAGGGGQGDSGGGGGGSGGFLGLDSKTVMLAANAILAANGGGGGTGCDGGTGGSGANAQLGTQRALGGNGSGCDAEADGGLGGALGALAGGPGMDPESGASGGGGGGGVGFIVVWGQLTNNATVSPAVTPR